MPSPQMMCGEYDDEDEEYYPMVPALACDQSRLEEVPARQPRLDLKPLKSALKKARPTAEEAAPPSPAAAAPGAAGRPLTVRQESST